MKLLTAAQSRELDRLSQEKYGVASYSLMTNAGEAVARAAIEKYRARLSDGALVSRGREITAATDLSRRENFFKRASRFARFFSGRRRR